MCTMLCMCDYLSPYIYFQKKNYQWNVPRLCEGLARTLNTLKKLKNGGVSPFFFNVVNNYMNPYNFKNQQSLKRYIFFASSFKFCIVLLKCRNSDVEISVKNHNYRWKNWRYSGSCWKRNRDWFVMNSDCNQHSVCKLCILCSIVPQRQDYFQLMLT